MTQRYTMKKSLKLFRFAGINVYVHWTFSLLLLYVAYTENKNGADWLEILESIGFVLSIFLCVVMHEYGHALAARKYGIETKDINILPMGGVARLERMPEKPQQELWVALAGPLVNVVIAFLVSFYLVSTIDIAVLENELALLKSGTEPTDSVLMGNYWFNVLAVNILLVVFNLIPAFPMDGGRIFRALLSMKIGRIRATKIASIVGQVISVGFVGIGFYLSAPMLILVGIFIFLAARAEALIVIGSPKTKRVLINPLPVEAAMDSDFEFLYENEFMHNAIELTKQQPGMDIMVMNSMKQVVGMLRASKIESAMANNEAFKYVSEFVDQNVSGLQIWQSLYDAIQFMKTNNASLLPVFDEQKLVGTLRLSSGMDVLNRFTKEKPTT